MLNGGIVAVGGDFVNRSPLHPLFLITSFAASRLVTYLRGFGVPSRLRCEVFDQSFLNDGTYNYVHRR